MAGWEAHQQGKPDPFFEGHHDYNGILRITRPATRIGREVIFEGGECRRLGLVEYALVKVGIKRTVARAARKGLR